MRCGLCIPLDKLFPANWGVSAFIQDVYYNRLHDFTMDLINTDPPAENLLKILLYDSKYGAFVSEFGVKQSR